MSTNFFSRGSISTPNTRFHMVGVIEKGTLVSTLPDFLSGLDTSTSDIYFMLCANHFTDGLGNEKQRVYWSCDPTDFVLNYNSNSVNQGVVNMVLENKSGNDSYTFKFLTSKSNNVYSMHQYFGNNLTSKPSDIELNNHSETRFQISQQRYNLRTDQVYTSIPYNLENFQELQSNSQTEKYGWCFRKHFSGSQPERENIVIDSNATYTASSLFTYSGSLSPFVETNVPRINFTPTDVYAITSDTSNKYFSIPKTGTNSWGGDEDKFNLIRTSNGVITFTSNTTPTNKYTFKYHSKNVDSDGNMLFHYEGLTPVSPSYGTTNFFINGVATNCNITYELRNDPYGFDSIANENPTTNTSDWFKIYFIPSTSSAFFPGGYSLSKTEFYSISSLIPSGFIGLNIYSPNDGQNINTATNTDNNYKQFYFREFSNFFILNTILGPITGYWTNSSEDGYPNIAVNPVTTTNNNPKSTIFTWTTQMESHHDYMYNYCENLDTCAFCFGNGPQSQTCVTHENSKSNAINSSLGNAGTPVFLTAPKDDNTIKYPDNNNNENLALIVLGAIFGVLALIIMIVLIYFNSRTYYVKPKKYKTYNPAFEKNKK